jgi:hypothetical protein
MSPYFLSKAYVTNNFKIQNEILLREHAMIFMNPNVSQDEIVKSGEKVIASVYGGIIYVGFYFL